MEEEEILQRRSAKTVHPFLEGQELIGKAKMLRSTISLFWSSLEKMKEESLFLPRLLSGKLWIANPPFRPLV